MERKSRESDGSKGEKTSNDHPMVGGQEPVA